MNNRQNHILEILSEKGSIGIKELAEKFRVSQMTIRRDLTMLEKERLLSRTHGGGRNTQLASLERFLGKKMDENREAKQALARCAAQLVEPEDVIVLDTGTTVIHMVHHLRKIRNLTVATPSLAVATSLIWQQNIHLIVLGGTIRPWSPDLMGPLTVQNIRGLRFKKAFLGADGIHPEQGFFCSDIGYTNVAEAIVKSSEKVFVLADRNKAGRAALARYADFPDVNAIITDVEDDAVLSALQAKAEVIRP